MPPKKKDKKTAPPKEKGKSKKEKKGSKKKEPEEIDWASDAFFEPSEAIVNVEMDQSCFVFKEQLDIFQELLQTRFPQTTFRFVINSRKLVGESGPRRGSFEIWFAQNARCNDELLWTGVKLGPPRRLKFSNNDYEDLWPQIKKILARFYQVEEPVKEEEDDD